MVGPRTAADCRKVRPAFSDPLNRGRIRTVVAVVLTSNLRVAQAPGNVTVPAAASGLRKDSVANVSRVVTLDKGALAGRSDRLPAPLLRRIDEGLRLVLGV